MKVLDVQKLIETQSQKHKGRLLSQYSRLLESSPSFVTYYSIDGVNSTAELGTGDVMIYVGDDSSIKFKKINNMPIYAVNAIFAEIVYDEIAGTYTEYEDQAMVLNSVLKPMPGDHFIIEDFNPEIIFVVSDVKIRAIRGEDHYIIDYTLVPTSRILNIQEQVVETYETFFRNIGTEDKVLIKRDDYLDLGELMESYRMIHDRYIDENYDKQIGYLKTPEWLDEVEGYGTCKYLIKFLMEHRIVYFDDVFKSIFAFESVLPFDSKHNKIFRKSFPLTKFIKKNKSVGSLYIVFRPLAMSLFTDVYDENIEQSIEFKFIPEDDEYTAGYKEVLLYDADFMNNIVDKDYASMTDIGKIIGMFINDEDIEPSDFNKVMDDYDSTDIFRYYFMPFVLLILKIKIKSLQVVGNM